MLKRAWLLTSVVWFVFNVAMMALDRVVSRPDLWVLAAAPLWIGYLLLLAVRYVWDMARLLGRKQAYVSQVLNLGTGAREPANHRPFTRA